MSEDNFADSTASHSSYDATDDDPTNHHHRADILRGIDYALPERGVPGACVPFRTGAFAILTNADRAKPLAMAAAAEYGEGRVVLLAHEEYLCPTWEVSSHALFIRNCIAWVSRGALRLHCRNEIRPGYVTLWDGSDGLHPSDVVTHVREGGCLVAAQCPWGFLQLHPEKSLKECPINKALAVMGLLLVNDFVMGEGTRYEPASNRGRSKLWRHKNHQVSIRTDGAYQVHHSRPLHASATAAVTMGLTSQMTMSELNCVGVLPGWPWEKMGVENSIGFDFGREVFVQRIEIVCLDSDKLPVRVVAAPVNLVDPLTPVVLQKGLERLQTGVNIIDFQNSPMATTRVCITFFGIANYHLMKVQSVKFFRRVPGEVPGLHTIPLLLDALPETHTQCLISDISEAVQWAPTPERPLALCENSRLLLRMFCERSPKIFLAQSFPGRLLGNPSASVIRGTTPSAAREEWLSTYAYAAPGSTLTITVTENPLLWSYRVGCHHSDTTFHDEWLRWPVVSETGRLQGQVTHVKTRFGGLVYLVCDDPNVSVSYLLEGAVWCPHASPESGYKLLHRGSPAPWGELAGELIVFSLPTHVLLSKTDKELCDCAAFWDSVVRNNSTLALPPHCSIRRERVVCDVQTQTGGYMQKGYPIVTHMDAATRIVNIRTLQREGDWGLFHMLGANMERDHWRIEHVTANFFTLYSLEMVCGQRIGALLDSVWDPEKFYTFCCLKDSQRFEMWEREVQIALYTFAEIRIEFGWSVFRKAMQDFDSPSSMDVISAWMMKLSMACGNDLSPLFDVYRVPVDAGAKKRVSRLPKWSGATLFGMTRLALKFWETAESRARHANIEATAASARCNEVLLPGLPRFEELHRRWEFSNFVTGQKGESSCLYAVLQCIHNLERITAEVNDWQDGALRAYETACTVASLRVMHLVELSILQTQDYKARDHILDQQNGEQTRSYTAELHERERILRQTIAEHQSSQWPHEILWYCTQHLAQDEDRMRQRVVMWKECLHGRMLLRFFEERRYWEMYVQDWELRQARSNALPPCPRNSPGGRVKFLPNFLQNERNEKPTTTKGPKQVEAEIDLYPPFTPPPSPILSVK